MACLKVLLVLLAVLSSQLLTTTVADSNIADDAQTALEQLNSTITSSIYGVYISTIQTWLTYALDIKDTVDQQLTYDVGNFSILLKNLTEVANNITHGEYCVSGLETFLDMESYNVDVFSTYRQVFYNLELLAMLEVNRIRKEYDALQEEFSGNCVENSTECESSRKLVIAEVKRLIPAAKRIPYEFAAEVHLLAYRVRKNWEVIHTNIVKDHNKAVQNATTCLVYNAKMSENSTKIEVIGSTPIWDTYASLKLAAEMTLSATVGNLTSSVTEILLESRRENDITISNTRNAIFVANQTINSLLKIAEDFNVTSNCNSPNLTTILNSSILRGFNEFTLHVTALETVFTEGLRNINTTFLELDSLGLQVEECSNEGTCDFVSKKLVEKIATLPLEISAKGNVTAALLYQPLQNIRESGSKVVLDALEQVEANIVSLKSCIRLSLYDY